MAEATALFHCVCGADIPLENGKEVVCPRCARRHQPRAMEEARLDTVVLAAGGAPAVRRGDGPARPSLVGQSLDHFQILGELGQGGVGKVYRALDKSLERYVALKVLSGDADTAALETFVHEARAQARLNHPGITTIYYVGRHGDIPYFAMEYVPGRDLEARVKEGPLPPAEVVRIGIQAVRALSEANLHGITHRDIKPGNFIQSSSGAIKLTDFGLSKTERGGLQITGKHSITGTPYYIAPEQARGESTDLRTDIYSLGAMLYHLAYGRPPFEGDNFVSVISKHLGSSLEFPLRPPADLPAGFPDLIARMMEKYPARRFQDYAALERALLDILPESQVVASRFRRAATAFLDWSIFALLIILLTGLMTIIAKSTGLGDGQMKFVEEPIIVVLLLMTLGYQIIFGRTGGKQFSKIRIASIRGGRPTAWALGLRWVFQWLALLGSVGGNLLERVFQSEGLGFFIFIACAGIWSIDSFWAFIHRKRRTLHDLICGTWVLEDRG
jgi:eukaryotic-like serine/threonine-protein kinase